MKYRLKILPMLVGFLFLNGCHVSNSGNYQQLHQEFNGTWQPVHSITDQSIDADLDGESSRFLLEEITNWDVAFLSLQILKDSDGNEYPHLFNLPYPDQYFPPESNLGDQGFYINYNTGLAPRRFKITRSEGQLSIQLQPKSGYQDDDLPHYKSIAIKSDHLILEVVMEIELLTADGWQMVEFTTRYARIGAGT
ncbi:hypothetical protein [Fodinibius salsisoli]|uniref:Lipocalin-like domain-containing protein n=1 Tax=Fodinibius salsisoli TaxID=2820877 RepID=A0ABT3PQC1_9BACT|nr:hypothetical protein [Fodinibius salsisoli]MCW9708046.1 hypothetical protein [Fodinibius salsisoli]